jgi:hypothetical protein
MEYLVAWVVLSAIPAWIASTKGRSPLTWFVVALLISPLLAFIIVIVVGPGSDSSQASPPAIGVADEISKLVALRDAGTLTADEYERQKAGLLAPVRPASRRPDNQTATCSRCGQLQSPYWRDKCNHCGALYAQHPPIITRKG